MTTLLSRCDGSISPAPRGLWGASLQHGELVAQDEDLDLLSVSDRVRAYRSIPSWYLLGTQDRAIPPAAQRFMAERGGSTIQEVPASHASFVSQPGAATQLILTAVAATTRAAA